MLGSSLFHCIWLQNMTVTILVIIKWNSAMRISLRQDLIPIPLRLLMMKAMMTTMMTSHG